MENLSLALGVVFPLAERCPFALFPLSLPGTEFSRRFSSLGSLSFSCRTPQEICCCLHLISASKQVCVVSVKTRTGDTRRVTAVILAGEAAALGDLASAEWGEFSRTLILRCGRRRGVVRTLLTAVVFMLTNAFLLFSCYGGV